MTDDIKASEARAETAAAPRSEAERRAERLKAALRDNLRRRKAQVRGRKAGPGSDETPEPGA